MCCTQFSSWSSPTECALGPFSVPPIPDGRASSAPFATPGYKATWPDGKPNSLTGPCTKSHWWPYRVLTRVSKGGGAPFGGGLGETPSKTPRGWAGGKRALKRQTTRSFLVQSPPTEDRSLVLEVQNVFSRRISASCKPASRGFLSRSGLQEGQGNLGSLEGPRACHELVESGDPDKAAQE